jgi:hypothetical protein
MEGEANRLVAPEGLTEDLRLVISMSGSAVGASWYSMSLWPL